MEKKINEYYPAASYYTIDEYGNIYNYHTNYYITQTLDKHGYYQVKIYIDDANKKRASYLVHRLVATTYLEIDADKLYKGRYSNGYTVDHIDGNKTNNYYKNLRWISLLDNCNEAKKLGWNNPEAGYTDISEELAKQIIQDILDMYSIKEIMERRGCSKNVIMRIRQKSRWKSFTEKIDFPITYSHRSRDETLDIVYYALNSSLPASKLIKYLGNMGIKICKQSIDNIRLRKTLKDYIKYVENNNYKPSTTIETF